MSRSGEIEKGLKMGEVKNGLNWSLDFFLRFSKQHKHNIGQSKMLDSHKNVHL